LRNNVPGSTDHCRWLLQKISSAALKVHLYGENPMENEQKTTLGGNIIMLECIDLCGKRDDDDDDDANSRHVNVINLSLICFRDAYLHLGSQK